MRAIRTSAPRAQVRLRAHLPAPARVELVYQPAPGRILRTALCLLGFWGAIPLLLWVPPHYPWVIGAFAAGLFLAYRQWTGRYQVHAFAGICPRCGHALSLGVDRAISLPHTLTCYHCHFEPELEVQFGEEPAGNGADQQAARPDHHLADCVGRWSQRWLADEPYLVCDRCLAHCPASDAARRWAQAENARADLLQRLTREGDLLL